MAGVLDLLKRLRDRDDLPALHDPVGLLDGPPEVEDVSVLPTSAPWEHTDLLNRIYNALGPFHRSDCVERVLKGLAHECRACQIQRWIREAGVR
jgi:hypothetical protein